MNLSQFKMYNHLYLYICKICILYPINVTLNNILDLQLSRFISAFNFRIGGGLYRNTHSCQEGVCKYRNKQCNDENCKQVFAVDIMFRSLVFHPLC